jgi:glycosyltransferase involved in cell wall biosynthesis
MKIVYFIDHLRADGTQRALQQLVEGLAKRGHQQTVICLNNSSDDTVVCALQTHEVEVRFVGKAGLVGGYGIAATWGWLRQCRFDVAVTLLFFSDVIGRAAARAAKIPWIVSSLRARNTNYAEWQRFLVRGTMRWADVVIINSRGTRDFAISAEGAPPERIIVVPNGIYVDNYRESMERATLRAEFGLPAEWRLIGSVGRLTHQKGHDLLIAALARLSWQDVNLLLVGVGEAMERLRALARALGVEQRVHFAGYRRDVPRLLGALDLYVHPARFEGMPNALLEAMAAGCPIIASAVDGNRELIEDGVHGWLVASEDVGGLRQAIESALRDRGTALRRGAAAQQRAATEFGIEGVVTAWEAALTGRKTLTNVWQ